MAVVCAVVKTQWAGTSGGPGLTQHVVQAISDPHTWDASEAQIVVNAVRTFWNAHPQYLSTDLSLTVLPTVDIYTVATGELVGSYVAASAPATVTGTNVGSYSMATGAKLNLLTSTIRDGRRVRGAWFIVPTSGDVFDNNGQVSSTPRANWVTDANALMTTLTAAGLELAVWSRPSPGAGSSDGAISPVTAFSVNAKGAILRGRRD